MSIASQWDMEMFTVSIGTMMVRPVSLFRNDRSFGRRHPGRVKQATSYQNIENASQIQESMLYSYVRNIS